MLDKPTEEFIQDVIAGVKGGFVIAVVSTGLIAVVVIISATRADAPPEITSPDARFPAPEIIETSTERRLVRWDFWANYEEHRIKALPIVIGEVHRVYDSAPGSWAAESHYGHYTAGDHCLMTGFETAEEAATWLAMHYLSMME